MCSVCKRVEKLDLGDALQIIGEALADPDNDRAHLDGLTERLMADGEPAHDDPELAQEYYRRLRGES